MSQISQEKEMIIFSRERHIIFISFGVPQIAKQLPNHVTGPLKNTHFTLTPGFSHSLVILNIFLKMGLEEDKSPRWHYSLHLFGFQSTVTRETETRLCV